MIDWSDSFSKYPDKASGASKLWVGSSALSIVEPSGIFWVYGFRVSGFGNGRVIIRSDLKPPTASSHENKESDVITEALCAYTFDESYSQARPESASNRALKV